MGWDGGLEACYSKAELTTPKHMHRSILRTTGFINWIYKLSCFMRIFKEFTVFTWEITYSRVPPPPLFFFLSLWTPFEFWHRVVGTATKWALHVAEPSRKCQGMRLYICLILGQKLLFKNSLYHKHTLTQDLCAVVAAVTKKLF